MAVVTGAAPATRVVEANAAARERGIRAGMPEAEAVARCPELIRRPTSPACVDAARRGLLDACYGVSPRIEDVATGLVHIDVAGLGRLVGNEGAIVERLSRAGRAVGLPARVGVAGTRTAARIAARAGLASIAAGDEALALGAVPVSALEWPEAIAHALTRWGVATLGELAALPRAGLSARLGAPGLAAHDLARGGGLGRSAPPAERDLATVLARLVTLVGAEAVGAVALADSHRPDAFVPARLELEAGPDRRADDREAGDAVLALRRLRPPRRVSVVTDGERRPANVCGALAPEARVVDCAGPWRVSGDWWDAGAWARDEWDVALSEGAVCRVGGDLVSGEWYLDGVYD